MSRYILNHDCKCVGVNDNCLSYIINCGRVINGDIDNNYLNRTCYQWRHRKLKIVPSPTCPCGEEDQTTEHVLQIMEQTPTRANRTVAISNSASPENIWGLGGPEENHQLHHCCWTGRVSEREEEED